MNSGDLYKKIAGERAAELVENGMVVGLGTGSTVYYAIKKIGEMNIDVVGIPTSKATEKIAKEGKIKIGNIGDYKSIDIDIDGADEIDRELNLTKGRGGALFREKMVAELSERFIVVADESKLVKKLGEKAPLPVEVLPFGHRKTMRELEEFGCRVIKRDLITDNGNWVVDCYFENPFPEPLRKFAEEIKGITGVVEHGLFLGMADVAFVAGRSGLITLRV